jgi:hypothetical protein
VRFRGKIKVMVIGRVLVRGSAEDWFGVGL